MYHLTRRAGRIQAPGRFTAYTHRPGLLRDEFGLADLLATDVVSVECGPFLLSDLQERMADPEARQVIMEGALAVERVPELMGLSSHRLATTVGLIRLPFVGSFRAG